MQRGSEQQIAALGHLLNAVPLWGMVINGALWFLYQERSRYLEAQLRQGLYFHGLFLAALAAWVVIALLTMILNALFPPLGGLLIRLNNLIIIVLLAGYIGTCIVGAVRVYGGDSFRYPFVAKNFID